MALVALLCVVIDTAETFEPSVAAVIDLVTPSCVVVKETKDRIDYCGPWPIGFGQPRIVHQIPEVCGPDSW